MIQEGDQDGRDTHDLDLDGSIEVRILEGPDLGTISSYGIGWGQVLGHVRLYVPPQHNTCIPSLYKGGILRGVVRSGE